MYTYIYIYLILQINVILKRIMINVYMFTTFKGDNMLWLIVKP